MLNITKKIIREMQIKISPLGKCKSKPEPHCTSINMVITYTHTHRKIRVSNDVEKLGPLCAVGGNVRQT